MNEIHNQYQHYLDGLLHKCPALPPHDTVPGMLKRWEVIKDFTETYYAQAVNKLTALVHSCPAEERDALEKQLNLMMEQTFNHFKNSSFVKGAQ